MPTPYTQPTTLTTISYPAYTPTHPLLHPCRLHTNYRELPLYDYTTPSYVPAYTSTPHPLYTRLHLYTPTPNPRRLHTDYRELPLYDYCMEHVFTLVKIDNLISVLTCAMLEYQIILYSDG